ncbi:MAG: hypothetical protein QOI80_2286, partial [Solirubrobacteraceae bacterium]|nr:hypothetical protein [Solirubrobacteraceae bacterium]
MRATLAFLVALALAGCGGGDKPAKPRQLDTAKVEQAIRASIQTQRNLSARVVCPTGVVQQTGFRFACLAVYKGGS